jgi:hypothetical protein
MWFEVAEQFPHDFAVGYSTCACSCMLFKMVSLCLVCAGALTFVGLQILILATTSDFAALRYAVSYVIIMTGCKPGSI